jgi:hypothetical protein
VILGVNGFIWVGKPRLSPDEQDLDAIYSSTLEPVDTELRAHIARTRNCILAMNSAFILLDEASISRVWQASLDHEIPALLSDAFVSSIKRT